MAARKKRAVGGAGVTLARTEEPFSAAARAEIAPIATKTTITRLDVQRLVARLAGMVTRAEAEAKVHDFVGQLFDGIAGRMRQ